MVETIKSEVHGGFTWQDSPQLLLMILPNLLNPRKLLNNICYPIHEVLHTKHKQYPLETHDGVYVVEHDFLGRLVTVDFVREERFAVSPLQRLRQLFDRNFYYGHAQYFPRPFRLIERIYVQNGSFNLEEYLREISEQNFTSQT